MLQLLIEFSKHCISNKKTIGIIFLYIISILFFSFIYLLLWSFDNKCIKNSVTNEELEELTFVDVIYFSTSIQTTSSFSRLVPGNNFIKVIVLLQVFCVLFIIYGTDDFFASKKIDL